MADFFLLSNHLPVELSGGQEKHQDVNSSATLLVQGNEARSSTHSSRSSHSLEGKHRSMAEILDIVQGALACQSHADCSLALDQIFQQAAATTPAAAAPSEDNHTTTTVTSPSSPKQDTSTIMPHHPAKTKTTISTRAFCGHTTRTKACLTYTQVATTSLTLGRESKVFCSLFACQHGRTCAGV